MSAAEIIIPEEGTPPETWMRVGVNWCIYAVKEMARLREELYAAQDALKYIASQKRPGDMVDEQEYESADFEGGYDACVMHARIATEFPAKPTRTP